MADVFISHARQDRARAKVFADVIASEGLTVWWDEHLEPGTQFREEIRREIDAARCVVVFWSHHSVAKDWVLSEAERGRKREILISVLLDDVEIPMPFDVRHATSLADWNGDLPNDGVDACLSRIHRLLNPEKEERPSEERRPKPRRLKTAVVLTLILLLAAMKPLWDLWQRMIFTRAVERMTIAADEKARPTARFTVAPNPILNPRVPSSTNEVLITREMRGLNHRQASAYALVLLRNHAGAVQEMTRAVAEQNRDAARWSDLAAARYESSIARESQVELLQALTAADRALPLDSALSAARFNRALIVEQMGLTNQAVDAWRLFLKMEDDSAWTKIAQKRLDALEQAQTDWNTAQTSLRTAMINGEGPRVQQIVASFHHQARSWAETELLSAWGDALGKTHEGEEHLRIARTIGNALKLETGESLLVDSVAAIYAADANGKARLAEAHAAYRKACLAYDRRDWSAAEAQFRLAEQRFDGASPMVEAARLHRAKILIGKGHIREGTLVLYGILDREHANPRSHEALTATVHWELALCSIAEKRWEDVIAAATEALLTFTRLEEKGNIAAVETILADVYDFLGRPERAWEHRFKSFRNMSDKRDHRRLQAALAAGSRTELRLHHWDTALSLLNLEAEMMRSLEDPALTADLMARRSQALQRIGETAEARAAVTTAIEALRRTTSVNVQLTANVITAEARLLQRENPRESARILTPAITVNEQAGRAELLPELYLTRGRSSLAASDHAAAERDFRAGIAAIEAGGRRTWKPEVRGDLTVIGQELFGECIRLLVQQKRFDEAFYLVERARARALLDQVENATFPAPARSGEAIQARDLSSRLSSETVLVEFFLLSDMLIAFRVDETGLQTRIHPISREEVAAKCDALTRAITKREPLLAVQKHAGELYDLLFAGFDLAHLRHLVIVPSDVLQRVPFAALYDRATRQYLIEQVTLGIAPTASVFVANASRGRLMAATPPTSTLVIGNPTIAPDSRYEWLGPLLHAEEEAREIAELYGRSNVMLVSGAAATEQQFTAAAPQQDVIHFAGHAISDKVRPENSRLLFATADGVTGVMHASEIARLNLERTRLVVLSACSTIREEAAGEQKPSIADAFLAAGAPEVVGALWEIEDSSARNFFTRLHSAVASGHSPAEAVRDAQLAIVRSGSRHAHPFYWAPFEVLGGSGEALRK